MMINQKKLALSLGIVGALLLPMSTGSLEQFSLKPFIFKEVNEYDEAERQKWLKFHNDNHLADYDCIVLSQFEDNRAKRTKELCDEADKFKIIKNTSKVISNEFGRFAVETVLGFFVVSLTVLVGPRFAMSYIKWLTR
jgi:hypothetical protein